MVKLFMDNVTVIKTKSGDLPIVFAGTISKKGVSKSSVSTTAGKELSAANFNLTFWKQGKNVEYALKLMGKEYITFHKDDYDVISATAWGEDADYVASLAPSTQIVGCGVLRCTHGDSKDFISLRIAKILRPLDGVESINEHGFPTKLVYDRFRPLSVNEGSLPVFVCGKTGKFAAKVFNVRNNHKVAHSQLNFYKQSFGIDKIKKSLNCNQIAYESDTSASLKITAWDFDADTLVSKAPESQIIAGGVAQVSHTDQYGDSIDLTLRAFVPFAQQNSTRLQKIVMDSGSDSDFLDADTSCCDVNEGEIFL